MNGREFHTIFEGYLTKLGKTGRISIWKQSGANEGKPESEQTETLASSIPGGLRRG
jgi:hypothetical protein